MELELVLGPKAGFNKWNEHKWRNFLISPDTVKIKYGELHPINGILSEIIQIIFRIV